MNIPADHDDDKTSRRNGKRQRMRLTPIANQKRQLLDTTTMANASLLRGLGEAHLGKKLINDNNETNSGDEPSQERSAKNAI